IDGLNLYRFARNNPSTLSDPDGMQPEVTLLYGFSRARVRYMKRPDVLSERSITTIDLLNYGLGIQPASLRNHFGLIYELQSGMEVVEEGVTEFMQKASPAFKGSAEDARTMLESWSRYLADHSAAFDLNTKINPNTSIGKVNEFWKKNVDLVLSSDAIEGSTNRLIKDPARFIQAKQGNARDRATAPINWIFRRISKLGLDWVNSGSAPASVIVGFLNVGRDKASVSGKKWQDLTSEQVFAQCYKTVSAAAEAYEPITFSERRHLHRKGGSLSSRIRFINKAQMLNR
ncbi:hypothetical protein KDX38_09500, partial [Pseudomonas sp. CDFA 602]|uniref:hypothetical protein n=1 Tax=Pseudomonas californiensis TaxID=2829823 RepID=UPI001E2E8B02